jgi:hypothetical protein
MFFGIAIGSGSESTVTGEIFVASPRDSLLISVHSAKGCYDIRELRLAEADIGVNKALR